MTYLNCYDRRNQISRVQYRETKGFQRHHIINGDRYNLGHKTEISQIFDKVECKWYVPVRLT